MKLVVEGLDINNTELNLKERGGVINITLSDWEKLDNKVRKSNDMQTYDELIEVIINELPFGDEE